MSLEHQRQPFDGSGVLVLSSARAALEHLRALVSWADSVYLAYAWASSGNGKAGHWMALDLSKVRQAVIGLHFNQTEPRALEVLLKEAPAALKVIAEPRGVFHPKVIVGTKGGLARAIVGSSNFTLGGFTSNSELNVALEGPVDAPPLGNLLSFIDEQWSGPHAARLSPEWLAHYAEDYKNRPKPNPVRPLGGPTARLVAWADLDVAWDEYFGLIAAQDRRALAAGVHIRVFDAEGNSYLEEMEFCQRSFREQAHFEELEAGDRRRVAGFGKSTGYFGRMSGAGNFKNIVNSMPEKIGAGLDRLRVDGPVSAKLARQVTSALLDVHGVGLGVASRLLAVKRPDVFMPLNNANKIQVAALYGRSPSTAASYVEMLESLWAMKWWSAPEPSNALEARVWRGRVALFDAVVYKLPMTGSPKGPG